MAEEQRQRSELRSSSISNDNATVSYPFTSILEKTVLAVDFLFPAWIPVVTRSKCVIQLYVVLWRKDLHSRAQSTVQHLPMQASAIRSQQRGRLLKMHECFTQVFMHSYAERNFLACKEQSAELYKVTNDESGRAVPSD